MTGSENVYCKDATLFTIAESFIVKEGPFARMEIPTELSIFFQTGRSSWPSKRANGWTWQQTGRSIRVRTR